MRTEINCFLARSIGLPSKTIFNGTLRNHKAEKSRNLGGVIKEKEDNITEIRSIVKSSHTTRDTLDVNFEKHAVRIYV